MDTIANTYRTSKIAILIAVRNGGKYLEQQLDSLLSQTETGWAAYIHDDGSSDESIDIVNEYVEKYPDRFFYVDGPPSGGAKQNFFHLLCSVEAPFYMCCDQDDVWLPEKTGRTMAEMRSIETDADKPCLVYTDLKVADESLGIISESMDKYQKLNCSDCSIGHILVQNVVTGCTMMINHRLRDMVLELKNTDDIVMHDWWAALIAAQFGKLGYVDEAEILYRQHEKNDIGAKKINMAWYVKKLLFHRRDMRASLELMIKQAQALVETFSVDHDCAALAFSRINDYSKPGRIRICLKYNITSAPAAKQFAILLFV